MKHTRTIAFTIILSAFWFLTGLCQTKQRRRVNDTTRIENTIINFLQWHKAQESGVANTKVDTAKKAHAITKGGFPDTTTNVRIDIEGVKDYIGTLKASGYFSETYLNYVRSYFKTIDTTLGTAPKTKALVKINGLDIDVMLQTYDTDDILLHIAEGKFDRMYIVYNKAIARFKISKVVQMLFTLTKINNKWLIDYIGYDNTSKYSIGRE